MSEQVQRRRTRSAAAAGTRGCLFICAHLRLAGERRYCTGGGAMADPLRFVIIGSGNIAGTYVEALRKVPGRPPCGSRLPVRAPPVPPSAGRRGGSGPLPSGDAGAVRRRDRGHAERPAPRGHPGGRFHGPARAHGKAAGDLPRGGGSLHRGVPPGRCDAGRELPAPNEPGQRGGEVARSARGGWGGCTPRISR